LIKKLLLASLEAMTEEREFGGTAQTGGPALNVPYAPPIRTSNAAVYNTWMGYGIHTDSMDYLVRYLLRRLSLCKASSA
jgi:hypothetical protein